VHGTCRDGENPRYDVEDVTGTLRFSAGLEVLGLSVSGMAVETPARPAVADGRTGSAWPTGSATSP